MKDIALIWSKKEYIAEAIKRPNPIANKMLNLRSIIDFNLDSYLFFLEPS